MESIHRRYNNSIRSYQFILVAFCILIPFLIGAQSKNPYEKEVTEFLQTELVTLFQKAQDYNSLIKITGNLEKALQSEIKNLSISINPNAVIEYDITQQNNKEVIISDEVLPFLINYAGKTNNAPAIKIECLTSVDSDVTAFISTRGITGFHSLYNKVIFKILDEKIELRRFSFARQLGENCKNNSNQLLETESISSVNQIKTKNILTTTEKNPKIEIKKAVLENGQAFLYGFVLNHKQNGILTDLDTGQSLKVNPTDGYFFLAKKILKGHQHIRVKYQYGRKFIIDSKLVFIKS